MSQRHEKNRYYEKKYHTTEELRALAEAMGCRLEFKRMQGVFILYDNDTGEWTWVISPHGNTRVKRVRELLCSEWIDALSKAKDTLTGSLQEVKASKIMLA